MIQRDNEAEKKKEKKKEKGVLPRLETVAECPILEENEESPLSVHLRHESTVDRISRVIPHFNPSLDSIMPKPGLIWRAILKRTHPQ